MLSYLNTKCMGWEIVRLGMILMTAVWMNEWDIYSMYIAYTSNSFVDDDEGLLVYHSSSSFLLQREAEWILLLPSLMLTKRKKYVAVVWSTVVWDGDCNSKEQQYGLYNSAAAWIRASGGAVNTRIYIYLYMSIYSKRMYRGVIRNKYVGGWWVDRWWRMWISYVCHGEMVQKIDPLSQLIPVCKSFDKEMHTKTHNRTIFFTYITTLRKKRACAELFLIRNS